MLFIGFFYALISILLSSFLFYKSAALEKYSSVFMITFVIMFTIPFMYYIIRLEEKKDLAEKIVASTGESWISDLNTDKLKELFSLNV